MELENNDLIYFDNIATTPPDKRVIEAMLPYLSKKFGNPSSFYSFGSDINDDIAESRAKVAELLNAEPGEIYFTSCGSESNNWAIKGYALAHKNKGNHIIVSAIDHYSVLHTAESLKSLGFEVSTVPVDKNGTIDLDSLKELVKNETILVSINFANGEVGTIQPVKEITEFLNSKNIPFHTDAVQSVGHTEIDVKELGIDMLSLTGHRFYGPKGIGALYIKKGTRILPLIHGGIQESGKRAGTENVPGIIGLGKASEIAKGEMPDYIPTIKTLRDKIEQETLKTIEKIKINGHPENRLPNFLNISFEFLEGESILMMINMKGIAAASGSACQSKALKASPVLTSMGLSAELAQGSILFSFGKFNTESEADYLVQELPGIIKKLRMMSPLYHKYLKQKDQ